MKGSADEDPSSQDHDAPATGGQTPDYLVDSHDRPEDQPRLALERRVPHLLEAALRPASTRLTSTDYPANAKGGQSGAVGAGASPGTPGSTVRPHAETKQTPDPKPGSSTISNRASGTWPIEAR
jgi:hypothetical protein